MVVDGVVDGELDVKMDEVVDMEMDEELFIIIDPCTRSAHWLVVYGVEVLGSLKSLLAFLSQPSDYKCIFRRD